MGLISFHKSCNRCGNNDNKPYIIICQDDSELINDSTKSGFINYVESTQLISEWHQTTKSNCDNCNFNGWSFSNIKINDIISEKTEDLMKSTFTLRCIKYYGKITLPPSDDLTTPNEVNIGLESIYYDIITNWNNKLTSSQPSGYFEFNVDFDRKTEKHKLTKSEINGFSLTEIKGLMGQIQNYYIKMHNERRSK